MLLLKEREQSLGVTRGTDFDVPNHYAKLMYQNGKKEEVMLLLSLLPKSLKE